MADLTRNQLAALTEAKFASLAIGLPFLGGFLVTFPFALRAALRRLKETP
jgi:hypothetical protein